MTISLQAIFTLARTIEGREILTLRNRRSFSVAVLPEGEGLRFTPNSTGRPRNEKPQQIRAVLERYERTRSFRKADYNIDTFNASYMLALIKHFQDDSSVSAPLSVEKIEDEFSQSLRAGRNLTNQELLARAKQFAVKPEKVTIKASAFLRNPHVVNLVLRRAGGICEGCNKAAPFTRSSNNEPYLEIHHKIRLADDGEDTVENALALCPNCHRKAHYGAVVV